MGLHSRKTIAILALLVAGITLGGCGDSGSDKTSSEAGRQAAPQAAGGGAPQAGGPAAKDVPAQAPDLSVDQRSIIYTGSITIRVTDVNRAAAQATAIAAGAGGFVGGDRRNIADGSSDATLVLRIPADRFPSVVDQLAKALGTEEQRGISTEDVTEQVVDLDARIAVQQARVDSGRKLLARAKTLSDLVMLEKEVATREADLASLQAKKRRLADLTALSTITVVLVKPTPAAAPSGPPGFVSGLKSGWKALLASLAVLVTVLGALLPWLIALGLPAAGILYLIRRYRRRRPIPALATAGPYGTLRPGMPPGPFRPAPGTPSAQPPSGPVPPPSSGPPAP